MTSPRIMGACLAPCALLAVTACSDAPEKGGSGTEFRVGVLLPMTGPNQVGFEKSVNWAADEINQRGILGRKLVIDWEDIGTIPDDANRMAAHAAAARRFLDDPEVGAVIGTDFSDTMFELAPSFITAKKLLITPSATSADITRAFGGQKYIWRTVEPDIAQAELMVLYGHETGVERAALLSGPGLYGNTFFDWIPFHAEEVGIEMTAVERIAETDASCDNAMRMLKSGGNPDIIYAAVTSYDDAYCVVDGARALFPSARIMLSDAGQIDGLFSDLGARAEGVEGVSIEAYRDPSERNPSWESKFDLDFQARYGEIPPPYAANAFDSVALVAYALAASKGEKGEAMASALQKLVASEEMTTSGESTRWDGEGMRRALERLEAGEPADVSGATGALTFDAKLGTDITASTYAVWQVKAGVQQWDEIDAGGTVLVYPDNYFTKDERRSKFDTVASERLLSASGESSQDQNLDARHGMWAFIAAFSRGWDNYRHQADALAVYQRLRENGVADDRIVLMLADDLVENPLNPEPGVVRNVAGGPNLRENVELDYRLGERTTSAQVLRILGGQRSADTPIVLSATKNDDVFVFWVGHGGTRGLQIGGTDAHGANSASAPLSPQDLGLATQQMFEANGFRRLLMVLEACHGGVMGKYLMAPRAILMTGAGPGENSFGANFDVNARIWRADAFAWSVERAVTSSPMASVMAVYQDAFFDVRGSHAKLYNAAAFGANEVSFLEFMTP